MKAPYKVSTINTMLLALLAAIVLHVFLLTLKLNVSPPSLKPVYDTLTVSLFSEKLDKEPDVAPQVVNEIPEETPQEKKEQNKAKPVLVNNKTVITKLTQVISEEPHNKPISVSTMDIKSWANREAGKFMDEQSTAPLIGLRKGSFEERLLDPNRKDQRTSLTSDKISTSDGQIHVQKVAGKTVCRLVGNSGAAFNDLALAPISGKKMGYNCGNVNNRNVLIDENGRIKNSDLDKWSVDD